MVNTKVDLCGIQLDNPVMAASGTFGYGYEFAELYDINVLGSFSFKGTTLESRFGNPTPRIAECSEGLINSIGLQNPGVEKVISEEEIVDMADFFKVFGDPTRLRILFVLWENEECNVGTISEKVKMSQSAVSQQLKILRSSRLVKFRKDGRSILYRLSDEHITKILQLGLEHYDELLG